MCGDNPLCYAENGPITTLLNDPAVRRLLGATTPNNFTSCSNPVGTLFESHLDKWRVPTHFYVASLLDRGVRMLIYAGTYDWQCNWVSNREWVEKLEWSGGGAYRREEWRDWYANVEGDLKRVGETKSTGGLTFATIRDAGHMMSTLYRDDPSRPY
jgi:carboxypeptidase C (cathepsin A)